MIPVAGILVFFVYVLLFYEIFLCIRGGRHQNSRDRELATVRYGLKMRPVEEPKKTFTLDLLWKSMRRATEQLRLITAKDMMVTHVMSEARAATNDAIMRRNTHERLKCIEEFIAQRTPT